MGLGALSPWHIAIFVLVVMLVFGPKRLPEAGRALGRGIREFKSSVTTDDEVPIARAAPDAPRALPTARERDSI